MRKSKRRKRKRKIERFMESGFSLLRMYWSHEPGVIKGARKRGDAPQSKRWREIRASLEEVVPGLAERIRQRPRQRFMESKTPSPRDAETGREGVSDTLKPY
jgi:hypothetical protein